MSSTNTGGAAAPNTAAPAGAIVTVKEKQQKVSDLLEKFKGSISQALPKHITPDRMTRVALTAMTRTPALLECTPHSLISAVMTAAQLGLMPDSILGECYLIPFKNNAKQVTECQIIIGYKGLCALAMRSGQVKSVQARAVFMANGVTAEGEKGDDFEFELGLNEKLKHVPNGLKEDKYITHFYSIVKFNNGGHVLNVMTIEEVLKIRNESKNYAFARDKASTIWGKYLEEMGCKTVLRRLMKYVPLSPELQRAVGIDEAAAAGLDAVNGVCVFFPIVGGGVFSGRSSLRRQFVIASFSVGMVMTLLTSHDVISSRSSSLFSKFVSSNPS